MLNTFTVSFFGHKDFSEHLKLEPTLEKLLKDIISEHEYVEFLIGRNGEFDIFVSSIIRKVKLNFCSENNELVCVLSYNTAEFENNKDNFLSYYDRVEIYTPPQKTHFKAKITSRNKDMVMRSNLVVCFVEKNSGGAFTAMNFAEKLGVPIINLAQYTDNS